MDGFRLRAASCLFSLLFLSACGTPIKSDKAATTPAYTPPSGSTGTAPIGQSSTSGFQLTDVTNTYTGNAEAVVTVMHKSDTTYDNNLTVADDGVTNFSTSCSVSLSDFNTAAADFLCILEIEELDLYFHAITLRWDAGGSCSYLRVRPYDFYGFQPGDGPTYVSYAKDLSGTVIASQNWNVASEKPQCVYDYSLTASNLPNCCVGSYTLDAYQEQDDHTYVATPSSKTHDGSVANCLSGPAMSTQDKDAYGFPMPKLYQVASSTGGSDYYTIPSAIDSKNTTGSTNLTDVWAGNWYRGSEHTNNVPVAMRAPSAVSSATLRYTPSDTYKFECLDRAQTTLARIRLMIRKWNRDPIGEGDPSGYMEDQGTDAFGVTYDNRWGWAATDFDDTYPMSSQ